MEKYHFDNFIKVVKKSKMIPVVVIGYEVIGKDKDKFMLKSAFEIHPNVKENPNMQDIVLGAFKGIEESWDRKGGIEIVEAKK